MTTTKKISYPFYPAEKIAIFIDGVYLYSTAKALDFDIDYKRLLAWVGERGQLLRSHYYTVLYEDQEYSPIKPLVDWLNYNGFKVVVKSVKGEDISGGRRKYQDMNVELAVDAMALAERLDHVFLFSGDSNLIYLVQALQRAGIRVTIFGTTHAATSLISDDLRRQADHFVEVEDLIDHIGRDNHYYNDDDSDHNTSGKKSKITLPDFIEA